MLVRFSRPAPLLGKHIITEFVLVLFVSIKAAMDLLSIAILLQPMCLFLLPSKQSSGKSSIYGFCFGRREEDIKECFGNTPRCVRVTNEKVCICTHLCVCCFEDEKGVLQGKMKHSLLWRYPLRLFPINCIEI